MKNSKTKIIFQWIIFFAIAFLAYSSLMVYLKRDVGYSPSVDKLKHLHMENIPLTNKLSSEEK